MFSNIVLPKRSLALHMSNDWFLALHAFTHGFPAVQPLVPSPTCVQSFNHLFQPPHVFNDCIPTLPNTPCNPT